MQPHPQSYILMGEMERDTAPQGLPNAGATASDPAVMQELVTAYIFIASSPASHYYKEVTEMGEDKVLSVDAFYSAKSA